MSEADTIRFNIYEGDELTRNVRPLLHEIRHALAHFLHSGEAGIIDLRSIPLAPGEEEKIIETLGRGEVHAHLNALGPSEIYETQYAGVWLVTHYNEESSVISRFIEICKVPEILKSQVEDVKLGLQKLTENLETNEE